MRLKTEFWIKTLIREQMQRGNIVTIAKKGDADAGTPFIILIDKNREIAVLREQPQVAGWERVSIESQSALDAFFHRQENFDPDLWILELELRTISDPIETELTTRLGAPGQDSL